MSAECPNKKRYTFYVCFTLPTQFGIQIKIWFVVPLFPYPQLAYSSPQECSVYAFRTFSTHVNKGLMASEFQTVDPAIPIRVVNWNDFILRETPRLPPRADQAERRTRQPEIRRHSKSRRQSY
jgi:hypothetical protein